MDIPASTDTVTVLERQEQGNWKEETRDVSQALNNIERSSILVIFARAEQLRRLFHSRGLTTFRTKFLSRIEEDLLGSLYSNTTVNGDNELQTHIAWTCFKIKHVRTLRDYTWFQIGVFTEWDVIAGALNIVFFDVPTHLQEELVKNMNTSGSALTGPDPFHWHLMLAEVTIDLYDDGFWFLRDQVRDFEKNAGSMRAHATPNFGRLHDISRHVFHFKETIESAEHTLQYLIVELDRWMTSYPEVMSKNNHTWIQAKQDLLFVEKEIFSLKLRSRSLLERHENEINLALNIAGRMTQSDSTTMRTIAVLSLIYLPGTFVSGLFGTNFFSLSNGDNGLSWTVSDNFWLYWAVTIPLTVLTFIVWAYPTYVAHPVRSTRDLMRDGIAKLRQIGVATTSDSSYR